MRERLLLNSLLLMLLSRKVESHFRASINCSCGGKAERIGGLETEMACAFEVGRGREYEFGNSLAMHSFERL